MPNLQLEVRDLCFRYPDGRPALQGVTFTVGPGESVGLVGANGAGKTSLFLCLTGVLLPTSGTVQVAGLDVQQPAQRKLLSRSIGIVFQDSDDQLFSPTVRDDVAFGPLNLGLCEAEVRQCIAEALAQVGMTGYEDCAPFHLSGGEKRRVALAGVLAMRPEILLLDEPSMFLDPRGRRELIALLNQLERTKVIASHDLDLVVQTCSRVLILHQGQIVGDGETGTLLADEELMERYDLEVPWSLRR